MEALPSEIHGEIMSHYDQAVGPLMRHARAVHMSEIQMAQLFLRAYKRDIIGQLDWEWWQTPGDDAHRRDQYRHFAQDVTPRWVLMNDQFLRVGWDWAELPWAIAYANPDVSLAADAGLLQRKLKFAGIYQKLVALVAHKMGHVVSLEPFYGVVHTKMGRDGGPTRNTLTFIDMASPHRIFRIEMSRKGFVPVIDTTALELTDSLIPYLSLLRSKLQGLRFELMKSTMMQHHADRVSSIFEKMLIQCAPQLHLVLGEMTKAAYVPSKDITGEYDVIGMSTGALRVPLASATKFWKHMHSFSGKS